MSDTQTKRLITWRVQPVLLGRVDAAAKVAGMSRTRWLEWAVESALEDARGGVPDAPGPTVEAVRKVRPKVERPEPPAGYEIPKIALRRYEWDK